RPLVLPPPLRVRPPVLPPRGEVVARPTLHVIILGEIFNTREEIGENTGEKSQGQWLCVVVLNAML
ncbi:hypothetical protein Tco_1271127, partial [Tanacetum coccineum]